MASGDPRVRAEDPVHPGGDAGGPAGRGRDLLHAEGDEADPGDRHTGSGGRPATGGGLLHRVLPRRGEEAEEDHQLRHRLRPEGAARARLFCDRAPPHRHVRHLVMRENGLHVWHVHTFFFCDLLSPQWYVCQTVMGCGLHVQEPRVGWTDMGVNLQVSSTYQVDEKLWFNGVRAATRD